MSVRLIRGYSDQGDDACHFQTCRHRTRATLHGVNATSGRALSDRAIADKRQTKAHVFRSAPARITAYPQTLANSACRAPSQGEEGRGPSQGQEPFAHPWRASCDAKDAQCGGDLDGAALLEPTYSAEMPKAVLPQGKTATGAVVPATAWWQLVRQALSRRLKSSAHASTTLPSEVQDWTGRTGRRVMLHTSSGGPQKDLGMKMKAEKSLKQGRPRVKKSRD